ncbi:galactokinase [Haloferax mediterranei ATCC 33500]|uniref:Galactokinase n=1 Tax=Haloferax mediterranei (strain ATCC 33500 / DSM 1411 / JCM 8866 / NBRC 14739 / NCIMB 2177 / R-4) TaxID=523841 RepID=I3R4U8_HALMT|nr:galactokinase [Haloferax mediterranei]AFK19258.1 galactokinase [Haloferax mediterranei ATCC 33500]AHZ21383.1 galactokinase [Haloferax mediterranei ATCC 33500]EMA04554.1 galactokinase [Haloferax mediterranei ATCC 33500]MDX5989360.1 galactokinase [Haloferax mediterranei ATCC 33500]QCQ75725.1 galactokinase [Haloferax mediterranei ATCC 33500]
MTESNRQTESSQQTEHGPVNRARAGLQTAFGTGSNTQDPVVALAPGRVNLVGGHTDYNDGLCLPMAVDRYVAVAARPRDDDLLRVHATDFDGTARIAPGDDPDGWAAYIAAVARVLREQVPIPGSDLAIASTVPSGAGLSSSAALELATGRALLAVADAELPTTDLALACWRAEREGVGVECGILDQFAVGLCKSDSALFLDCRTREYEHVPLGGAVGILVIDTGVSHELADSGYNDRVRECREAVTALRDASGRPLDTLRDVDRDLLESHADALEPVHYRRAKHVVTENERVNVARDALSAGDFERVGEAMVAGHESLRDEYEVSSPELDAAVELATEVDGVYGARMTGGGFGGSAVALVDGDELGCAKEAIRAVLPERVGSDARVFACRPSGGVGLVHSR